MKVDCSTCVHRREYETVDSGKENSCSARGWEGWIRNVSLPNCLGINGPIGWAEKPKPVNGPIGWAEKPKPVNGTLL